MDIYIYGAGEYGRHSISRIRKYYKESIVIKGIIDEFKTGLCENIPIISVSDVEDLSIPIIVSLGKRETVLNVSEKLQAQGFKKVHMYLRKDNKANKENDFFKNECINIAEGNMIPHIEMHAVDYCNLNCKACIHFSPLFSKEDYNEKIIFEDMKLVAGLTRKVLSFFVMGGEPFLRKDLDKVVISARSYFPDSDIQIITNGLLLKNVSEKIWCAIKESNVMLSISEYEPTARMHDAIIEVLERNQIQYSIRGYEKKEKFIKTICLNKENKYPKCCICDGCVNVYKGYASRCPAVMYLNKLNKVFSLELPEEGIYKLASFTDVSTFNRTMKEKIQLCDYCVNSEIEWERCSRHISMEDFVVT